MSQQSGPPINWRWDSTRRVWFHYDARSDEIIFEDGRRVRRPTHIPRTSFQSSASTTPASAASYAQSPTDQSAHYRLNSNQQNTSSQAGPQPGKHAQQERWPTSGAVGDEEDPDKHRQGSHDDRRPQPKHPDDDTDDDDGRFAKQGRSIPRVTASQNDRPLTRPKEGQTRLQNLSDPAFRLALTAEGSTANGRSHPTSAKVLPQRPFKAGIASEPVETASSQTRLNPQDLTNRGRGSKIRSGPSKPLGKDSYSRDNRAAQGAGQDQSLQTQGRSHSGVPIAPTRSSDDHRSSATVDATAVARQHRYGLASKNDDHVSAGPSDDRSDGDNSFAGDSSGSDSRLPALQKRHRDAADSSRSQKQQTTSKARHRDADQHASPPMRFSQRANSAMKTSSSSKSTRDELRNLSTSGGGLSKERSPSTAPPGVVPAGITSTDSRVGTKSRNQVTPRRAVNHPALTSGASGKISIDELSSCLRPLRDHADRNKLTWPLQITQAGFEKLANDREHRNLTLTKVRDNLNRQMEAKNKEDESSQDESEESPQDE